MDVKRTILGAVAASCMAVLAIAPALAATDYGPGQGYEAGPKGGDNRTQVSANPSSGQIMIFQRNDRQGAAVHCVGEGPYAKLRVNHPITDAVSGVEVDYSGATMSEHPVIDVLVTGSKTGWLGHGASFGPKVNESGTIKIPLQEKPVPGETMVITFGLQTHAGCLPHPTMLGLTGSRPAEGGQATFPSVRIG
jgi:hypothetical protein